jgi:DNA-binding response OmpR family regulator
MSEKRVILVIEDDKYISHFIDISLSKKNYLSSLRRRRRKDCFCLLLTDG